MSIGLYDKGATTVLILPLAAMHEEYKGRAKHHQLTCETWSDLSDIATAPQLLLVAVENCPWPKLQAHIETLIRLGRLARIVVDEAHLLEKHESFRPCMSTLSFLGRCAISIVLMTATCPYRLEKDLFQKLGRGAYQVVRRSTDRAEISQEVISIQAQQPEFEKIVAAKIISTISFSTKAERALLFCNSRDESDRMAKLLCWRPYHSSIPIEDRSEAMQLWKDGAMCGLACTSMLNCCLDYPYVRYVFHLGPPRDVIDYYQAIGRAARAGGTGKSVIFFNPACLRKPSQSDQTDRFGKQVIHDMLLDASLCRRLRPMFFLDGVGVPCSMLPAAQLCDVCTTQSNRPPLDSNLYPIPALPSSRLCDVIQPSQSTDFRAQVKCLPDPMIQPAPLASFATHLAAATSFADGSVKSSRFDQECHAIRLAGDHLSKTCSNCWSNGFEFNSHSLAECPLRPFDLESGSWIKWVSMLRFPIGCCFYCGCPHKVCPSSLIPLQISNASASDCLQIVLWSNSTGP